MANARNSKSKDQPVRPAKDNREITWVNVKLDEADVHWIETSLSEPEDVAAVLLALATLSVNLFVKFKPSDATFTAGMIAENPDDTTTLLGLSGWSDNLHDAIRSLAGKWYSGLDEQWSNRPEQTTSKFR